MDIRKKMLMTREMHKLFCDMLYDTIFKDTELAAQSDSTMFK